MGAKLRGGGINCIHTKEWFACLGVQIYYRINHEVALTVIQFVLVTFMA